MKRKVVIALNTAWNLYNFRAGLIRALVAEGYEVVAVAPPDEYATRLAELGCRFVPLAIDNRGTHPGRDLLLLWRFYRLLRSERPDVFLGYTIKPNIYGSLAAHVLRIPVVNNIAGLGSVFINDTWLTRLVRCLYRVALAQSRCVFFQNNDDLNLFVQANLVSAEKVERLPGSGIDLRLFQLAPISQSSGKPFCFLLVARMLRDKGVVEYVDAARIVRLRLPDVEFSLLGFVDVQNPTAISSEQMSAWVKEGVVRYLGVTDNVKPYMAESDCIVLPSYREGTPRSLLEAAAIGRPIITTDAIGCKDVVNDGENGYLCRVKDAQDLADKMLKMVRLSCEELAEMGRMGRQKVEREFDENFVIERYINAINRICEGR